MTLALVLAAAVVVSFAGTAFARRYALKRQLIDNPNQRSSHAMPTPRGGGLAIVFSFVGGTAALWALGVLDEPAMPIFLISALSVAAIGFWDDHGHVSARWRLLVHFIAAGALVAVVGQAPSITIASLTFNLGTPGLVIAVILVVWVLNLYNFMDGIDGIAAAEAITAAGGAAVILLIGGHEQLSGWLWLLAASCLGFAFWNKPPARIFMGDVGSGFLGFVLAGIAVITCVSGAMSVWSWGLLLGVFVVDATVTLLRRMLPRRAAVGGSSFSRIPNIESAFWCPRAGHFGCYDDKHHLAGPFSRACGRISRLGMVVLCRRLGTIGRPCAPRRKGGEAAGPGRSLAAGIIENIRIIVIRSFKVSEASYKLSGEAVLKTWSIFNFLKMRQLQIYA